MNEQTLIIKIIIVLAIIVLTIVNVKFWADVLLNAIKIIYEFIYTLREGNYEVLLKSLAFLLGIIIVIGLIYTISKMDFAFSDLDMIINELFEKATEVTNE